jgi:hypothetical protein
MFDGKHYSWHAALTPILESAFPSPVPPKSVSLIVLSGKDGALILARISGTSAHPLASCCLASSRLNSADTVQVRRMENGDMQVLDFIIVVTPE